MEQELQTERKNRKFDLLAGNQILYMADYGYLAIVCGKLMNNVAMYQIERQDCLYYPQDQIALFEFDMPVKQLSWFNHKSITITNELQSEL